MKEYDTYLLDFDGTLFDSKESLRPVFRQGFGKLGIEVTDEECEVFMHHTLLQSAQMKNVPESRFRELLEAITIALDSEESLSLIKPFSDTVYLISELKRRKKRFAVVSGNISAHIRTVLKMNGMENDIETVVGSDMFKHGKPSPEPLETAMAMLGGCDLATTVYVGDSAQDEQAALAAGVDSIIIAREESKEFEPKNSILSFEELFRC